MTCAHERTEPAETRDGPVCADCGADLPANWGCPDCSWVDVRSFGDLNDRGEPVPVLIPGMPCQRHRKESKP